MIGWGLVLNAMIGHCRITTEISQRSSRCLFDHSELKPLIDPHRPASLGHADQVGRLQCLTQFRRESRDRLPLPSGVLGFALCGLLVLAPGFRTTVLLTRSTAGESFWAFELVHFVVPSNSLG